MSSIWAGGKALLLGILEFFQGFTGSYGLAIILLTIVVRLLLYPLSQKQMSSMASMQKIQPRLKVIQEKYANDKQKLNEEMMRLYRENNVNPLAGCFPLLIQLPIMILLFRVLMEYNVADQVFWGIPLERSVLYCFGQALDILPGEDGVPLGIGAVLKGIASNPAGLLNIKYYLPSTIFTIFISFLTWYQQKISGAGNNPQMATMNVIMPFFMAFICLSLPGGVLLYWGTSSLIGIAQQVFVVRRAKKEAEEKPVLYRNKPLSGYSNKTDKKPEVLQTGKAKPTPSAKEEEYDEDEYEDDDEYEYYDDDDEEYDDEYEEDEK